jgi:hypothetical protein
MASPGSFSSRLWRPLGFAHVMLSVWNTFFQILCSHFSVAPHHPYKLRDIGPNIEWACIRIMWRESWLKHRSCARSPSFWSNNGSGMGSQMGRVSNKLPGDAGWGPHLENHQFRSWLLKVPSANHSIHSHCELLRNADPWPPPQSYWIETCEDRKVWDLVV